MLEIFDLKSSELSGYFTSSEAVMEYRNEVFSDMLASPELAETLNKLMPVLTDITELRRLESDNQNDDYLSSITEIELYISCIDLLERGFSGIRQEMVSNLQKGTVLLNGYTKERHHTLSKLMLQRCMH